MFDHIERALHPERMPSRKGCPTFKEWFDGRFWVEWVVAHKNKPTEVSSKKIIFKNHLEPAFGALPYARLLTRRKPTLVAAQSVAPTREPSA